MSQKERDLRGEEGDGEGEEGGKMTGRRLFLHKQPVTIDFNHSLTELVLPSDCAVFNLILMTLSTAVQINPVCKSDVNGICNFQLPKRPVFFFPAGQRKP